MLHLSFNTYQRPFKSPLTTAQGVWSIREGIIIRLVNSQGKIGWGEIAPLPQFGTETIEDAWQFCQGLGETITPPLILTIPSQFPCCQFGFESALENLNFKENLTSFSYCQLLPAGAQVLTSWQQFWEEGKTTFKWKIGVLNVAEEIAIFQELMQSLPTNAKLRLDANGSLTLKMTNLWLETLAPYPNLEFLEQPLPPSQFDSLLTLSQIYQTPLALDESVATLTQLERVYHGGWRGIFVIKGAIAGSPQRLRQFCQNYPIDAVFSSVFETEIGRQAVLQLAANLHNPNRAIGFGVNHWFYDNNSPGNSPTSTTRSPLSGS